MRELIRENDNENESLDLRYTYLDQLVPSLAPDVLFVGRGVVDLTSVSHVTLLTLVPAGPRPIEVQVLVVVACQGSFKVILSHV